jgi:hypothetical protein
MWPMLQTQAAVYSVNQLNAWINPCSAENWRLNDITAHTAVCREEPPLAARRHEEGGNKNPHFPCRIKHEFRVHIPYKPEYKATVSRPVIATGWTAGVRLPIGVRDVPIVRSVQTGSGAQPASYPMGTGYFFPGDKAARAWSWPRTELRKRNSKVDRESKEMRTVKPPNATSTGHFIHGRCVGDSVTLLR